LRTRTKPKPLPTDLELAYYAGLVDANWKLLSVDATDYALDVKLDESQMLEPLQLVFGGRIEHYYRNKRTRRSRWMLSVQERLDNYNLAKKFCHVDHTRMVFDLELVVDRSDD
jgi:hypothetical protein